PQRAELLGFPRLRVIHRERPVEVVDAEGVIARPAVQRIQAVESSTHVYLLVIQWWPAWLESAFGEGRRIRLPAQPGKVRLGSANVRLAPWHRLPNRSLARRRLGHCAAIRE